MTRVAAIDCGTNSIRLLVADLPDAPSAGGAWAPPLLDVHREMRVVRLGEGVDATGRLSDGALERTLAATRDYAALVRELGAERTRFVATSASRDASNASVFVDGVRDALGVEPEVVAGAQEAALSFRGAATGVPPTGPDGVALPSPYCVVDIGGGSTEVVLGDPAATADGAPPAALSVDVGCVRLTERHLRADPPTPEQVAAARADVDAALDRVAEVVPLAATGTLVGVAGTVTTITAHALGLPRYDGAAIHATALPTADVLAACRELLAMPREQRAALPFMHPGRVDVIGAGALVWERVVERVAAAADVRAVVTSEHDILDGIALSLA
ncbi:Ppx/GppA phosphatase family protein [Pseudokineococcus sp. 1T1Z-3]|uniref:Ppx/GppA phosphatase family protein n=1 Tax=Pseudokineococcus sp. 1T1Z-3 TaxID=3132745 RepID=UPI00309CEE3A